VANQKVKKKKKKKKTIVIKAYICSLKSRVVRHIFCFHAQISAVAKLYVLAMDMI